MVLSGVKLISMTNTAKAYVGAGVFSIAAGAAFLWMHWAMWAWSTYLILFGIWFVLTGASSILSGTGQKAARRLSFGFGGVALVFLGIGLATYLRF
jgi:hypothetical protein